MTQAPADRIKDIVNEFSNIQEWELKYAHIIKLGKALPNLDEELKTDDNKVKGCQSQVWLVAKPGENGTVHFSADSDAVLVRGLVAILLKVYSNSTPDQILATSADFIKDIGLDRHLSASRTNGLQSMLKKIQYYALAFQHLFERQ